MAALVAGTIAYLAVGYILMTCLYLNRLLKTGVDILCWLGWPVVGLLWVGVLFFTRKLP